MFEFLEEFDINHYAIVAGAWVLCLAMIWRFFDPSIMRLHLRIIMSIVMLPICFLIVTLFARGG